MDYLINLKANLRQHDEYLVNQFLAFSQEIFSQVILTSKLSLLMNVLITFHRSYSKKRLILLLTIYFYTKYF